MTTLLISHGPAGSGPSLMMHALGDALYAAGYVDSAEVIDLPGNDGADAIERVAAETGNPEVLASCTPTYLTTPAKKHLDITWSTLTPVAGLVEDTYLLAATPTQHSANKLLTRPTVAAAAPRGGNTHIQGVLLQSAGAAVTIEFYETAASAIAAVESGKADWTTGVASDFATGVSAGQLTVLASFDATPSGAVPTLRESGFDIEFKLWRGLMAPPALAVDDLQRWQRAITDVRPTQPWREYLATSGMRNLQLDANGFSDLLRDEDRAYREWLAQLDL